MLENYTNAKTKWAASQQDASGSSVNTKTQDVSGNSNPTSNLKTNDLSGNVAKLTEDTGSLFYTIFNKSNIIMIVWFLAIYFIAYFILGFFVKPSGDTSNFQLRLSNVLDMLFLGVSLLLIITYFYTSSDSDKSAWVSNTYKSAVNYINTPTSILSTGLFIVVFYLAVYLFRFPMTPETKPIFVSFIETMAWAFFVIIAFVDFFTYVLGIPLKGMFNTSDWWKMMPDAAPLGNVLTTTTKDASGNTAVRTTDVSGNVATANEVFNISNNLYTYDDSQAICAAYGAKLATYDQIEDTYNKGGEWCNYGWSDGQMIFFPTQKSTWNKLQTDPKNKNNCGRPGINGGFIANPYMKFGVNCYGTKPTATQDDLNRMSAKQNQVTPKSEADKALDTKVQYWKDNAAKLLQLNSYNTKQWSQIKG
jgi:hypothetical protein